VKDSRGRAARAESAIERVIGFSDAWSRKKFLRRHTSLLRLEVVEQLAEAVREKVRINLKEALQTAEAALHIAQIIGHPSAVARALRAKGNALHFLGQNKAAADLHAQAAALFQSQGDAKELGRTFSASIQPLILLGDYGRALAAARRAQRIFAHSGDKLRLGRLQINLGNIYHRQDRFSEALACYERAYSQLIPFQDAEGIASALHNIAVCLISLNNFRRATEIYEQARTFCEQHHMPLAVVQSDYNIAYLHYLRGEYGLAINMLRATRDQADQVADAYHAALCRLDLADIYLELNLTDEALGMAREAFLRFQQLAMGYETGKALTDLAIANSRQGKTRRALELLAQARTAFAKERNTVWPPLIDFYRATILLNKKQYRQSRSLCLKALKFFKRSPLLHRVILCRLLLVRLYLSTAEIELADRECTRALKEVRKVEMPLLAQETYSLLGQVYEARQNSAYAYQAYQSARRLLEELRSTLHRDEVKIAFVQDRLQVYEGLVKICIARPSKPSADEAFRYIEEAKSRSLREAISRCQQLISPRETKPRQSLRSIQDLRQTLNWCYHRMDVESLKGDKLSIETYRQLQRLAHKHEADLLHRLRDMPDSDGTAEVYRPGSVTLTEVREALGPDTTLVEFFQVSEQFLAVVVTPDRCEIVPVAAVSGVQSLMALMRFQFEKFRLGTRYLRFFREPLLHAAQAHLHDLYEGLLAPIRHLLLGRRLVFVPHSSLHYLPFHALFDGTGYLIDSYTISYAPSASVLTLCNRDLRRHVTARSLVLGVPDPRAPNILSEVQAVSALLPNAELFVGKSASEEILTEKGPLCSFIHIATHAYFRQDNPLFSGIRLGASYLTLLDLCRANLPAQLVTVSGCGTGMSVVAGGDELLGLVRGFFSAGARSLLLSLWDVHDVTTTLLMKSFYRRLRDGHEPALALQKAMMELRDDYPHPYHWAPFLLLGRCSP
jgi:CHAT domain-containing protein